MAGDSGMYPSADIYAHEQDKQKTCQGADYIYQDNSDFFRKTNEPLSQFSISTSQTFFTAIQCDKTIDVWKIKWGFKNIFNRD